MSYLQAVSGNSLAEIKAENPGTDVTGVLLDRFFHTDPFLNAKPMDDFIEVSAWLRELQNPAM